MGTENKKTFANLDAARAGGPSAQRGAQAPAQRASSTPAEGRATRAQATYQCEKGVASGSVRPVSGRKGEMGAIALGKKARAAASVSAGGKSSRTATTGGKGARAASGTSAATTATTNLATKRSMLAGFMAVLLAAMLAFTMSPVQQVFADDTQHTVPSDEGYTTNISSYYDQGKSQSDDTVIDSSGVTNVMQSTNPNTARTFASGLPLSTIYIDQSKVFFDTDKKEAPTQETHFYPVQSSPYASYINYDSSNGYVSYNAAAVPENQRLTPGTIHKLDGDLFYFIFEDAAIFPDGTRADLKVTYSNARFVVDQRLSLQEINYYNGRVNLAAGGTFLYGGSDGRNINTTQSRDLVRQEETNYYSPGNFGGGTPATPSIGTAIDATYQIVTRQEVPIEGSFIYAIAGINIDRDPWVHGSNNTGKPIWYVNRMPDGSDYHFFSEAMIVDSGAEKAMASDYIYVRSNQNNLNDYDQVQTQPSSGKEYPQAGYFFPQVTTDSHGNTVIVSNTDNATNVNENPRYNTNYHNNGLGNGDNTSYSSGFITLASGGFTVTGIGHGAQGYGMSTKTFSSTTLWYRYTSGSGKNGKIELTKDGNYDGKLNDGSDILPGGDNPYATDAIGNEKPNTYVVTEGKTVTYTMTPNIGYKLKKLTVNGTEVKFNNEAVSKMKKGDTITVDTNDVSKWSGNDAFKGQGILTYNDDGTYTFVFNHATADEEIFVEWEPTTADVLVSKRWQDQDDKDGLRAAATMPKVKLQYSTNRGRTWNDVTTTVGNYTIASFADVVTEQTVPDGKDSATGKYLDGTYEINNDQTGKHPYTWEYLPVYSYDSNGVADTPILYRIVETPDPGIADYLKAQYFDDQSFDLTSPKTKTKDGWLVFDAAGNSYVQKGDGLYYPVDANGNAASTPAATQPTSVTPHTSDEYYTVDKGTPYQAVEVKNEHTPREVYIDLTKFWNDEVMKNLNPSSGTNEYARKELTFVLHGETSDGAVVDLNGDAEGNDREITITVGESDNKADVTGDKTVSEDNKNFTVYKDDQGNEYAYVTDHSNPGIVDGYYPVSGDSVDTSNAPATGLNGLTPVPKGDGTYKIDDDHFGALIEHLSTHEGGKAITYTITEKIDGKVANSTELAWTTSGGTLTSVKNEKDEIIGYTTEFANTPIVDKDVTPLPITILKRDKITENVLENATFTVYTSAVSREKAVEYGLEKIDGNQVYTNDISKYVKKGDNKYYEVDVDGNVAAEPAKLQPDENTLKDSYTGGVDKNEVTTDDSGNATITFRAPGTYYVVETKAPTGYNADTTTYTFEVEDDLKSVTLKDAGGEHNTAWWEMLYDLIFGGNTNSETNWDEDSKTLTVDDDPIRANILINKVWDDNNDQDGLRKYATEFPKVKIQKTTDPSDDTSWADVTAPIIPNADDQNKTIPDHNAPLIVDQDNYFTWDNLPAYENGKLLTYRVIEFGGKLKDNGTFLPTGDNPEETGYAWTAETATGNEEEFNIANITDPNNPTSRNRTVTVTNKHVPEKIKLNVSKDWADDDDDTSKRATTSITLYKTVNGVESVVRVVENIVPLDDESKFTSFDDLPVYENGSPITYRIEETAVDHYGTTYKTSYMPENASSATTQDGDSINVSTVERTFTGTTAGNDRNETTEAEFQIKNAKLTEVTVEKTWINGATENVIYHVYRTTSTEAAVINWDDTKQGTTSTLDDTKTVYNWDPTTDTNWEQVKDENGQQVSHAFDASQFANSETGDTKEYTFTGLPVADPDGNTYTYRIYELNSSMVDKFEANQVSNTKVENTNAKAKDGFANVNVVKELDGRDWNSSDKFYFQIEPYKDASGTTNYGHAGAYGVDQDGKEITNPANVPMPKENNATKDVAEADITKDKVGILGRNVGFSPIEYTKDEVGMGKSAEYYYKVYEVYDANKTSLDSATNHTGKKDGITYAGSVVGGAFKPTEHTLRVIVNSDANGVITTSLYWDGANTPSAVPVYTNEYDASVRVHAHIIKQVNGREITGNDEFYFTITNIAGAPMRADKDATADTATASHNAGSIRRNSGSKVEKGTSGYDPKNGAGGYYRAIEADSSNWIKLSDLSHKTADGKATDTFIYRITENAPDAADNPSVANAQDLIFDSREIYLKIVATDNLDGTINIVKSYWYDSTCTTSPVNVKVLTDKDEGRIAPENATAGESHAYEEAALFTNSQTVDIAVKKEWVDAPAVEDVTLHLQRKLIALDDEAVLTYANAESNPGLNGKGWETVGNVKIASRGDFVNADGTPKLDSGSKTTSSKTYENIEGFNKDLPKYVTVDGVTYRAVYKLVEDDTSDSYKTTYRSEKGGTTTADNQIFLDGETLVVTNTVTATNTANIAAVKQLLGRQWLATDEFPFTLEAWGKGTYDADGKFDTIDETANIPMPNDTTAKATSGTTTVDPNGNLERLASFGEITYTVNDLTYDAKDKHYQGDFFYTMKEVVPEGAVNADGKTYSAATDAEKAAGGFVKDGITYDGTEHKVHVKVRENRTGKLQVQIAYDEKKDGDITTGTQFTPVYTNKYDATAEYAQTIDKYIMGRAWKDSDVFDFRMTALGGAPLEDADSSEFPDVDTHSDADREADLEAGDAIHSARGAHVKRMDVSDTTQEVQTITMPKIEFRLSELNKTVTAEEAAGANPLKYANGNPVPAGTAYGQFIYSFEEINDYLKTAGKEVKDLNIDTDTEYVRVTVIDKGNGTLDYYTEVFEDRYCTVPRIAPGTSDPATNPTFVNQLKRDVSITKTWADPASSVVTMRLQWSTNGTSWYDVDEANFLTGQDVTKVIEKDASGNALTVTWSGLPAYANIADAHDQEGDDIDLNDAWIYYTIKEDAIEHVITRYSEREYVPGESYTDTDKYKDLANGTNPFKTEDAPSGDTYDERTYASTVDHFYVTNWREDLTGTAQVGVVKQYIGSNWDKGEAFTFEMTPVKSKLGAADDYTEYDAQVTAHESDSTVKVMPTLTNNKATADATTSLVSVNEHAANFNPLTIKLSDLAVDPADSKAKGEFIYEVKEVIPAGAVEITEGTGANAKTYYVAEDENGNRIKYTGETHTVKILAAEDGSGSIDITVSYDERNAGEFVPVYTNYAMLPTPIEGTKTWVGGNTTEHINGTVTLDDAGAITNATDALDLQLYQTSTKDDSSVQIREDKAGRPLAIVWAEEIGGTPATPTGNWVHNETGEVISNDEYEASENKDDYSAEMTPGTPASIEKYESGNGTYTIKAIDGTGAYVDPFLDTVDKDGYAYTYSIKEGSVPTNYVAAEEGMDVTNTNDEKVSIKVTKEWTDGPAIEDVTLRIQRMLIPISVWEDENTTIDYGTLETLSSTYPWDSVGLVHNVPRGDFLDNEGMPAYADGTTTASHDYENIDDFNKDLPLYVTDENGVDCRAVYRLVEDDTSDAYSTTFRTVNNDSDAYTDGAYYLNAGDNPVVTNKVEATNEANIAAVKQLLGRDWASYDDFAFTLEPYGIGTYDDDDNFASVDTGDAAKAKVPMPKNDDSRESTTAGAVSTTHAKAGMTTVDPKGNLERLARFGAIEYTVNDLVHDAVDNHMQGDFFYTMKEVVPADATDNGDGTFTKDDITYDGTEHTVHVKVRENRTGKLQVQIAYDEETLGDITTGTQFTPVYTNKVDAETSISGTKVWNDDGRTHDNTTELKDRLVLNRDWMDASASATGTTGVQTEIVDPSEYHLDWDGNNFTFSGMPKKDANGNVYTYWVSENTIVGYSTEYSVATHTNDANEDDGITDGGTITNTPKLYALTVTKTFDGLETGADPKTLFPNFEIEVNYQTVDATSGDFKDADPATLKLTDNDVVIDGFKYTWTISDVAYDTAVTATESGYEAAADASYTFVSSAIANTSFTEFEASPAANPTKAEFTMPMLRAATRAATTEELPTSASVDFTNTYKRATGNLALFKNWEDDSNSADERPDSITYTIRATDPDGNAVNVFDGSNTKQVTFTGEYNDYADTWNDFGEDNPQYSLEVPIKTPDGKWITYTVTENDVTNYVSCDNTGAVVTSLNTTVNEGETSSLGFTNVYNKTDVEITKQWVDTYGNTTAGDRPSADRFKSSLKLNDGNGDVTATYADKLAVTDNNDGTFTAKWSDLPKYKIENGNKTELTYSVTETQVPGYGTPVYSDNGKVLDGGTITNTQLISINVVKNWDDNNNHDNQRPTSIKVKLFRNGDLERGTEVTLKKDEAQNPTKGGTFTESGNKYTWTKVYVDLPYADENGVPYNYTAVEVDSGSAWYEALLGTEKMHQILLSTWNDAKNTLTYELDNKYDDQKVGFTVDKIWDDANNIDGLRPEKIYYRLYEAWDGHGASLVETLPSGASVKLQTNTAGAVTTDGSYANGYIEVDSKQSDKTQGTLNRVIFENLPKYADGGKVITYTIEEDGDVTNDENTLAIDDVLSYTSDKTKAVKAYTKSITGSQDKGFTVKNSHTPVEVRFTPELTKTITGREFKAGDSFTFKLKATGDNAAKAPTPTPDWVTITPTSGTTAEIAFPSITFTGDLMADKLEEGDTKTFTYEVTEVNGGKTLNDLLYDGTTKTVTVTLTRNADGTISATYAWSGDDAVKNTFTNEYGATTKLTLRKVWVDTDADDTVLAVRPDSVNFTLTATTTVATSALETAGFTKVSDTTYTKVYTLSEADDKKTDETWQQETADLPKYDAAGKEITFAVTEDQIPNYSTPSILKVGTLHTVINTYERTEFTGTKVWVDGGKAHDNTKEVKLTVYRQAYDANNDPVGDAEAVGNTHIHWDGNAFTITGLPAKDASGNTYTYWVTETAITGYDTAYSVATHSTDDAVDGITTGGTITNTVQTDSLMVTKVWDDEDDAEGLRPESVTFHLYKQVDDEQVSAGVESKTITDTAAETQNVTWTDLPVYENGAKITYKVVEEAVAGYIPGYSTEYTTDQTIQLDGDTTADPQIVTVTNSLTPGVTEVVATKVWDDNDNADGKRPDQIQVKLYERVWDETEGAYGDEVEATTANGQIVPTVTLDGTASEGDAPIKESAPWTVTFGGLQATKNGKTVLYSVKELTSNTSVFSATGEPGKYSATPIVTGDQVDGFTITNTYVPESHRITITKTFWEDAFEGAPLPDWAIKGSWPEAFPFQIRVHYTERAADGTTAVKDAVLKLSDAQHDEDSGIYTWTIENVASGTEVNVTETNQDMLDGYSFDFAQMKQGEGEFGSGSRRDNINFTMPGEDTTVDVRNNYTVDLGAIIPVKVWDDENNLEGLRPEKVTFTVTATLLDEEMNQTDDSANVFDDSEGNPTNVFEFDVEPGARYASDEAKPNEWAKLSGADKRILDFLPMMYEGRAVSYKVEEKGVPDGYTANVDASSMLWGTLSGDADYVTITNTHEVNVTSATITKEWDDTDIVRYIYKDDPAYAISEYEYDKLPDEGDEEHFGKDDFTRQVTHSSMRPETLSMELWRSYLGADDQLVYELVQPVVLSYNNASGENTWKATVENLPAHLLLDDGTSRAITYYWKETVPASYTATVTGDDPAPEDYAKTVDAGETTQVTKAANGETITNTLNAFGLSVVKTWADGDNREGVRPSGVNLRLYATTSELGEDAPENEWVTVGHVSVSYNDGKDGIAFISGWFDGESWLSYDVPLTEDGYGNLVLPAYKDGKIITYWLEEDDLNEHGYKTTYKLSNDGAQETEDGISFSFDDREMYPNGKYSDTINVNIANRLDPDFSITKVWDDAVDTSNRPSADEFAGSLKLYATSTVYDEAADEDLTTTKDVTEQYANRLTVTDNGDGTYTVTWSGLPQWVNGVSQTIMLTDRIVYHVEETQIEGYLAPIYTNKDNYHTDIDEGAAADKAYDHGTITNALTTELIDIPVTKVWDDNNNEEGLRPNSVNVVLYADGTPVATKSITTPADDETSATVTFEDMRKYREGSPEEITYTVKEEAVPEGYTATLTGTQRDGLIVTNTHAKEMIPAFITKVWDDDELLEVEGYKRPDKVTIRVTGTDEDGNVLYEEDYALTSEDGEEGSPVWSRELELPVNIGGTQVFYFGEELPVEGYDREQNSSHAYSPYVSVIASNTPKMAEQTDELTLTVVKVDADDNTKKLAGAKFKLVDPLGNKDALTTDANGQITLTLAEVGTYTLVETAPPADYKLGETNSWTITTDRELKEIKQVTEGESIFWNRMYDIVIGNADGFDAETATLTVENPAVETKTIKYVDPENEDTSKREVLETTIKTGEDEPAQPADPTRDGYTFTGWERVVDPETGDVTYTATWKKIGEHTVKYTDPDNEDPDKRELVNETVKDGDPDPAQPADPTREGYTFKGWDKVVDPETGDVTYTASWEKIPEPEQYSITYEDGYSDEPVIQSDTINRGEDEPGQPADPEREGYIFGGWQRSMDGDGNVTYKARWVEVPEEPDPGTITISYVDGDNTIFADVITRGEDEPDQIEDPTKEGYVFMGWKRTVDKETGDVTYTAKWEPVPEEPQPEPTTSITVRKAWSDNDDADGVRPDHVTVRLLADGNVYRTAVLTEEDDWTYTWEDLPLNVVGTETAIEYTAEEADVAGYEPSYTGEKGTSEDPLLITNTHVPAEPITLVATKVWDGEDGDASARKDVVFHLMKVVEGYGPIMVEGQDRVIPASAEGEALVATWENLPSMEDGKKVTYTVEEETVTGYTVAMSDGEVDGNTISVTVTNTLIPVPVPDQIVITYENGYGEGEDAIVQTNTINRGDDEPGQPGDPTRDGYIFSGWDRVTDPATGNVTYTARWTPVEPEESITITYEDGQGNVIEGWPKDITRGDDEPTAPDAPTRPGYTFTGWERTTDADGNVTYTATWAEIPGKDVKLTYIDPKAADGSMILLTKDYRGQSEADEEADKKANAPENPTHDGYQFVGWAANQDEFGDWVLVAKYNEVVEPDNRVLVSYVDPKTGKVVKSEKTDDPSSVAAPEEAPEAPEGTSFVGWGLTIDENGNYVFAPLYASDCANPAPDPVTPTPAPTPVPKTTPVPTGTSSSGVPIKATPKTADEAPIAPLMAVLVVSAAGMLVSSRRRMQATVAVGRHSK